jgi:putative transposase
VLLTETLKLRPSLTQTEFLLATMKTFNSAANHVAGVAFANQISNPNKVHHLTYFDVRSRFGLSAQMTTRARTKACNALKRDRSIRPTFRELGSIAYDARIMTWKGPDVSLQTLSGRVVVPVVWTARVAWLDSVGTRRSMADLIFRDGHFYLAVVVDVPDVPLGPEPNDWLGVDLGLVNIAVDSDNTAHSGKEVRLRRYHNRTLRTKLQSKGTKSAKRLLKKRRRKESRFARHVNHCISKQLVSKAKGTGRGIKLEDLKGIRDRTTVSRAQRADKDSWSFGQLRSFVTYKARISGVHLVFVDPRNTSRECPKCHYVDKKNRKTRDWFCCLKCGFAAPADFVGATNIRFKAAIDQPYAAKRNPKESLPSICKSVA